MIPAPRSMMFAPGKAGSRTRPSTLRKRDQVLDAATALIAERGFEATSMRDVCHALGMSLAGLYHYVRGKEELLFQIQYRTFSALLESQERTSADATTSDERFRRLLVGHLAFFGAHRNELKVCTYELESLHGEMYQVTEELRRRYYQLMTDAIAAVMGDDHSADGRSRRARHASLFVFGMLNWIFMWYDAERHGPAEQVGDEMLDMVLNGIRRKEQQ